MKKRITTGLKSICIIAIAVSLIYVFGVGSLTKFLFKKILFTPYNIVGLIMTVFTIFGGYVTKRQGHVLLLMLTILSSLVSIFSYVSIISSWFNIDLWDILITQGLLQAAASFGIILLKILLIILGIMLIGFVIYCTIKIIHYAKEDRKCKEKQVSCESQKENIHKIAKENNRNNDQIESLHIDTNFIEAEEKVNSDIRDEIPAVHIDDKKNKDSKQISLPNDFELKISNNLCPSCGRYLKKRINKKTGEQFRGCTNFAYHGCTFTISDEEYIRIYKKCH